MLDNLKTYIYYHGRHYAQPEIKSDLENPLFEEVTLEEPPEFSGSDNENR